MPASPAPGSRGYLRQFLGTVAGTLRFSGRATRTEVVVFYFGVIAFQAIADLVLWLLPLPDRATHWSQLAVEWLAWLPLPALFVRRAHDHGRRAAWVAAPLFVGGRGALLSLIAGIGGIDARIAFDRYFFILDGLAVLAAIAAFAIIAAPGNPGPNRFGPDPRDG